MYGHTKIPTGLWIGIVIFLIFTMVWSPNIELMIPIVLYIPFIYRLFYIKGNSNIIFWGLFLQWLNVSIQVIYCTVRGYGLSTMFNKTIFPADLMDYTDFLSIYGMFFFAFGLYQAVKKLKIIIPESIWEEYDPKKVLQTYIIVSLVISVNQIAIWAFPGIVQYIFFFFYIKWGFLLVAFISVFKTGKDLKVFLFSIIGFEFVLGLSSYFASSFAFLLLFSLIGYATIMKNVKFYQVVLFSILGAGMFHMAVLWTAAKGNYRSYLSQGKTEQAVKVSSEAARAKLLELIVNVDELTYTKAIEEVINRIGYIHYFAAAVRFVPAKIPHEDGKIYADALAHYLVPRFLDPNKPELDDSKHTNKYTGLGVSGKAQATSFSLGSFADAYIDFGPVFMIIPLFLFGFMIGYFFKVLYTPDLWGIIFTGPFFLLINVYGADTAKAIGFVLIYFLVMLALRKRIRRLMDKLMRPNLKI
ncbi:MAG TPA: hypothetical protein PKK69_02845 [Ferruginibacter sp.]|nr:hypothetical protein [Ferruginibacter sp.]